MIDENYDELGYFFRPSHGGYPDHPDSLTICNGMIGRRERDKIVKAAIRAHEREPLHYNDTTS